MNFLARADELHRQAGSPGCRLASFCFILTFTGVRCLDHEIMNT
jgi:hypothetical protein